MILSLHLEDYPLNEGRFCLSCALIDQGGASAAEKAFEAFYTQKGRGWIGDRVIHLASKVGVRPIRVTIKDLGYRWGSCTSNDNRPSTGRA